MREFEESPMVAGSGDLWRQATRAEFLSAIGDGTLPEDAFRRWLAQDYLFARGLTTFQAIATAFKAALERAIVQSVFLKLHGNNFGVVCKQVKVYRRICCCGSVQDRADQAWRERRQHFHCAKRGSTH